MHAAHVSGNGQDIPMTLIRKILLLHLIIEILLKETIGLIQEKKYQVVNIDCTMCLQEPKIKPYIQQMQKAIAEIIGTSENNISIKATTTEQMGFVGRKEGVVAYATVLLETI